MDSLFFPYGDIFEIGDLTGFLLPTLLMIGIIGAVIYVSKRNNSSLREKEEKLSGEKKPVENGDVSFLTRLFVLGLILLGLFVSGWFVYICYEAFKTPWR